MARYVTITRSSQVPMLISSDIDIREITGLSAEVMDILTQIFGARVVRVWQHPVRISTTALYYVLSLLSDKFSPGQGFCGIQMWFPMLTDSVQGRLTKFMLDPSCTLPREDLARLGEKAMIVSVSITEALLPYLGFVMNRGINSLNDLRDTVASDDSDTATAVARALNEEEHQEMDGEMVAEGTRGGERERGRLQGSNHPSTAANRVGYTGIQKWLYDMTYSIRRCQNDSQYKWASSIFTHGHLWFFLAYGVYFSPVLRAHAVRLIRACRVETVKGRPRPKRGVADRINLKVLAWLVGSRLALLAFYGTYRWLYQRQQTQRVEAPLITTLNSGNTSSNSGSENEQGQGQVREELPAMESAGSEMKNRSCPLCMDNIKHPITTRCGHMYCHICLHDFLRRRGANYLQQRHSLSTGSLCPVCRASINVKELRHIFT